MKVRLTKFLLDAAARRGLLGGAGAALCREPQGRLAVVADRPAVVGRGGREPGRAARRRRDQQGRRHRRPADRAAHPRHRGRPDQGGQLRAAARLQRQGAVRHRPGELGRGAGDDADPGPRRHPEPRHRLDRRADRREEVPARLPRHQHQPAVDLHRQRLRPRRPEEEEGRRHRRHLRLRHGEREDGAGAAAEGRHHARLLGAGRSEQDRPRRRDEQGARRRRRRGDAVVGRHRAARPAAQRARRHGLERAGGRPPGADGGADQEAAQQARVLGEHLRRRLPEHHLRRRRQAARAHAGAGRQGQGRRAAAARSTCCSGGSRWATTP